MQTFLELNADVWTNLTDYDVGHNVVQLVVFVRFPTLNWINTKQQYIGSGQF